MLNRKEMETKTVGLRGSCFVHLRVRRDEAAAAAAAGAKEQEALHKGSKRINELHDITAFLF